MRAPLMNRNGPWPASRLLDAFVARQQGLEVSALELRPAIDRDNLRKPPMPLDACRRNHHARAVAWCIKREIQPETPPGEGIDEQCHPRTAQDAACARTEEFYVQFGVVDMPDLTRPVTVAGRCRL